MKTKSLAPAGISSKQLLWIFLFLDALAVTIAIAKAMLAGKSSFHYFGENTFITYFSCFQLVVVAVFAWMIFRMQKQSEDPQLLKNALFWLIVAFGAFFLSLDDALSFHEQIDQWLHRVFEVKETEITDLADDILVGIYMLIALICVASQWKVLQVFRSSFRYFKIGFVIGAVMVGFDILSNNTLFVSMVTSDGGLQGKMITWMGIIEETAKLVAEGFFVAGTYQCWRKAKTLNNQLPTANSEQSAVSN
ncbi:MAG: hypothetical protein AAFO95_02200 [Cyanobacteria bacterium J06600_6]